MALGVALPAITQGPELVHTYLGSPRCAADGVDLPGAVLSCHVPGVGAMALGDRPARRHLSERRLCHPPEP